MGCQIFCYFWLLDNFVYLGVYLSVGQACIGGLRNLLFERVMDVWWGKKCAMVESGIGKDVYLAPKCTKKFKYMRAFPQTTLWFNNLPLRDVLILASY